MEDGEDESEDVEMLQMRLKMAEMIRERKQQKAARATEKAAAEAEEAARAAAAEGAARAAAAEAEGAAQAARAEAEREEKAKKEQLADEETERLRMRAIARRKGHNDVPTGAVYWENRPRPQTGGIKNEHSRTYRHRGRSTLSITKCEIDWRRKTRNTG